MQPQEENHPAEEATLLPETRALNAGGDAALDPDSHADLQHDEDQPCNVNAPPREGLRPPAEERDFAGEGVGERRDADDGNYYVENGGILGVEEV
ncbi:hypothetical protein C2S52_023054 [Perilla frutescens var. hirtella]|nr:hypothetical protein C2S52_023054 [Perilla frutescens var. hirtella]